MEAQPAEEEIVAAVSPTDKPVTGKLRSRPTFQSSGNPVVPGAIVRVTYSIAGQMIATRVTNDPVSGNNGLFYIYSDHLGSASLLVDSSNNPVAGSRTWYLPFGGYRPGSAPTQTITDRDFTGQRENMELGLLYYNARYYVPGLGRFASADTIIPNPANPQSYNRYSYVLNSPLKFVDPSGHFGICFQQGPTDQNDDNLDRNSELVQMCTELAGNGFFGASGSFDVFGNDSKGIQAAVKFLKDQMSQHPDEAIVVMGYSYGGGGALDFAALLHERGGDHLTIQDAWNDFRNGGNSRVPENVMIDRMVLIDAVVMGRQLQSRYAKNHDSLPPNVKSAINLYATEDAYGIISPFDAGLQNIEGALNIGMVGTDHCSIASSSCSPKFTNPYVPSQFSVPLRQNETGPINTQTLNRIKLYLNPPSIN